MPSQPDHTITIFFNLKSYNTPKYNKKNIYWTLGDIWVWRIESDGVRVEWFREAKAEGDLVKNKITDSTSLSSWR